MSPVLVDSKDGIIAGHGRVAAAKLLGMTDIPTVRVEHLTSAQIRAFVIADNKLAENAGWDRNLLALELQELSVELNFNVKVVRLKVPLGTYQLGQRNVYASSDGIIEVTEEEAMPLLRAQIAKRLD